MIKKENTPTIETERLYLRKFIDTDVEDVFKIYSDKEVNKFLPWFPFDTIEQAENYLYNDIYEVYKRDIAYFYAIVLKKTNSLVGYVCVNGIDEIKCIGELGYGLRKEYWNKGIATEACVAVLEKIRENGFKTIIATHDKNNPGSGEVMKKIGMTYRKSYNEQWQPKDISVIFKLFQIDFD